MDTREILGYFESRHDAIVAAIADIVDIESPSYNIQQSKRVVDCVVDMFHGLPIELDVERQFAEANGEHLIIRSFASGERPVLLLGHTDTVHPIGTNEKEPYTHRRRPVLWLRHFRYEGEYRPDG